MPTYNHPWEAPTELHRLLLRCVPPNTRGEQTISDLAKLFPLSRWSINKWIKHQKVPAERVPRLIEIGKIDSTDPFGRVRIEDFHRFVYKD